MKDSLRVRRGGTDDMDTILNLIDEAGGWLRGKDIDQWAKPWQTRAARDTRVRRGLRNGDTWIVETGGQPIATITYRKQGNSALWTAQEQNEPAVYVSRLIVTRRAAGLSIGSALVDWAGERSVDEWNAQWIRIDVWTTNIALHNYYEKRGFRFCRIASCKAEDYPSAALFQKSTSEINLAAADSFEVNPPVVPGRGGRWPP